MYYKIIYNAIFPGERLNYFTVGLSVQQYNLYSNIEGTYKTCKYHPYEVSSTAIITLYCELPTPMANQLVIRTPKDGVRSLTLCEVEAFADTARRSKC